MKERDGSNRSGINKDGSNRDYSNSLETKFRRIHREELCKFWSCCDVDLFLTRSCGDNDNNILCLVEIKQEKVGLSPQQFSTFYTLHKRLGTDIFILRVPNLINLDSCKDLEKCPVYKFSYYFENRTLKGKEELVNENYVEWEKEYRDREYKERGERKCQK